MYFGKDKNIVLSNIGIKMVGEKFKDENVVYLVNKSGKRKEIKISGAGEAGRYHAYEFGKYKGLFCYYTEKRRFVAAAILPVKVKE